MQTNYQVCWQCAPGVSSMNIGFVSCQCSACAAGVLLITDYSVDDAQDVLLACCCCAADVPGTANVLDVLRVCWVFWYVGYVVGVWDALPGGVFIM